MDEVAYLTLDQVLRLHEQIMERTGQPSASLRDEGLLLSALDRARNAAAYTAADTVQQAALIIEGIARNHPFVDGNKRTAAICGEVFLRLNGWRIVRTEPGDTMFGQRVEALVKAGDEGFAPFLDWLTAHVQPRQLG